MNPTFSSSQPQVSDFGSITDSRTVFLIATNVLALKALLSQSVWLWWLYFVLQKLPRVGQVANLWGEQVYVWH